MTLLSIIIATKEAADDLQYTLNSILRESESFEKATTEIILIDGLSRDHTSQVIRRFSIKNRIPLRIFSQQPAGIYPAMNMGVQKAHGEWLLFINSGDCFVNTYNLTDHLKNASQFGYKAIQFKSAIQIPRSKHAITKTKSWDQCHQSFTYKKELHQNNGLYLEDLRICSDRIFMSQLDQSIIFDCDQVLSCTQVSPKNTSRNPDLILEDLSILKTRNTRSPWKNHGKLKDFILRLEAMISFSASVWIKSALQIAKGDARIISIRQR